METTYPVGDEKHLLEQNGGSGEQYYMWGQRRPNQVQSSSFLELYCTDDVKVTNQIHIFLYKHLIKDNSSKNC